MGPIPGRTLNVYFPWVEALKAVGVSPASSALPAMVECPLCHSPRMTVYEDTILGGAWHYCSGCKVSLDTIELAAKVWGMGIEAAVEKLARLTSPLPDDKATPQKIREYAVKHVQYRQRFVKFWEGCREYMFRRPSRELAGLRDRFHVRSTMGQDRWLATTANMLGATDHITAAAAYSPKTVFSAKSDPGRYVSSGARMFGEQTKYGPWSDILAIPYHDLPGRLCGFLFIGRDGSKPSRLYKHLNLTTYGNSGWKREGGLACHWAIEHSQSLFGDRLLVCDNPFLALRMHVRHFASSLTPLPLVAFHDEGNGRTERVWSALSNKTPVLWGFRLTPSLLYQAMIAKGLLALTPLVQDEKGAVDHYLRQSEPRDIVRKALKRARPWQEAMSDWADHHPDGMVEELLLGMEAYGVDPRQLLVSERLRSFRKLTQRPLEVRVGRQTIVEIEGQWRFKPSSTVFKSPVIRRSELVMNAAMRIDGTEFGRGVRTAEVLFYLGRLIFLGREYPFRIEARYLTKTGAARRLQEVLSRSCPTAVLFVAPGWESKLVSIATQFGTGTDATVS